MNWLKTFLFGSKCPRFKTRGHLDHRTDGWSGYNKTLKINSFSCGRGIHEFFIGGFLPTHRGHVIFNRLGNNSSFVVKKLNFLERLLAIVEKAKIKNSPFFVETTNTVSDSITHHLIENYDFFK